jgi:hypothetical protein
MVPVRYPSSWLEDRILNEIDNDKLSSVIYGTASSPYTVLYTRSVAKVTVP